MNEVFTGQTLSNARRELLEEMRSNLTAVTEPLQPCSSYPDTSARTMGDFSERTKSLFSRDRYIFDYGYVLLTQECLAALVALLAGKKVIDVGAGTGFLVHCLRGAGVSATALDLPTLGTAAHGFPARQIWASDIADDFARHLPGDYDAVILSWPPMGTSFACDVAKAMRPGQILIYQGEGHGGMTADDDFFEYLDGDEWVRMRDESQHLNEYHRRFACINDRWMVLRKVVPSGKPRVDDIEEIASGIRPYWERIMEDVRGSSKTAGSCLHAAIVLASLLDSFSGGSAYVCGGGPDEDAGLRDKDGNLQGHYWVEGQTAKGEPFIADITADQFGYPPVVVLHSDEGRARYVLGDQEAVKRHVEEELERCQAEAKSNKTE